MPTRSRTEPSRFDAAGSRTESNSLNLDDTQLTEDQWFLIEDLFPSPKPSPNGGRPRHSNRACFEGILHVMISGCRWKDLPKDLPSKSVCHQRFQLWATMGIFQEAWQRLLEFKSCLGEIDLTTILGDGSFIPAKKGVMR